MLNLKPLNTYPLGTLNFFKVQIGNIYSFSINRVVFAIVASQASNCPPLQYDFSAYIYEHSVCRLIGLAWSWDGGWGVGDLVHSSHLILNIMAHHWILTCIKDSCKLHDFKLTFFYSVTPLGPYAGAQSSGSPNNTPWNQLQLSNSV